MAKPAGARNFGPYRYARNGGAAEPNSDPAAYNGGGLTGYNTPFNPDGTGSCARNYLIFIGNGFPNQDSAATLLTGVNGNATQLKMPQFTTITNNVSTALGNDASCRTQAACATQPGLLPRLHTTLYGCVRRGPVLAGPVSKRHRLSRVATPSPATSYDCTGGSRRTATTVARLPPAGRLCRGRADPRPDTPRLGSGGTSTPAHNPRHDPITESVAPASRAAPCPRFGAQLHRGTLATPIVTTITSATASAGQLLRTRRRASPAMTRT